MVYQAVPWGYRMWQKKESKLALAASMVRQVMPEFCAKKNAVILCDSWYAKKDLVCAFAEYRTKSIQEFRFAFSEQIRKQVFYTTFVDNIENNIKSTAIMNA